MTDGWTEHDRRREAEAGHLDVSVFTASADTTRDWAGTAQDLSVLDVRVHLKNHAEYHGLERHAWQYFASVQYDLAAAHFYRAAAWREADTEIIGTIDPGHEQAMVMCLQMARFSDACHARGSEPWPDPESFGLTESWVAAREERARAEIDVFSAPNVSEEHAT